MYDRDLPAQWSEWRAGSGSDFAVPKFLGRTSDESFSAGLIWPVVCAFVPGRHGRHIQPFDPLEHELGGSRSTYFLNAAHVGEHRHRPEPHPESNSPLHRRHHAN